MSNATPSRTGQINQAGDALAIFLKVSSGEVLTAFHRNAYFRNLVMRRTIPSGKSAQFPAFGLGSAFTHVPGVEILGDKISGNEVVIPIEGMNMSAVFVASIDDLMQHYDSRGIYMGEIGQALSRLDDQNLSRVIMNAARATAANVNGVYAGDVFTRAAAVAGYATDGPTLYNGLMDANVRLDQRDVPRDGRAITVKPVQYALLIKSEKPFDYRLNDGKTGLGGYAEGIVKWVDGVPVGKSNNYASTNNIGDATQPTARQHDYSTSAALLHHKSAVGQVALQDVTMETQWDMRRQGWLMAGKYVCGQGTLRPEGAEELLSSAAAG